MTGWGFVVGGVLLFALAAVGPGAGLDLSTRSVTLLIAFALVPTALAYSLFFHGLRGASAATATLVALLEPLTATVLAVLVLGDPATVPMVVGALMLLASIVHAGREFGADQGRDMTPTVRRAQVTDLEAVVAFPADPSIHDVDADRVREDLAANRMRSEWTYVAEDAGRIVGRALWWGRSDSTTPLALDSLHVRAGYDRAAVGAALLNAATFALPEYVIAYEPGQSPSDSEWRIDAAARAGLTERVERLQMEWTPSSTAPPASSRLTFRSGTDDEFVDLFARAAVGTQDITTIRALDAMTPAEQARDDLEFYRSCPGERSWWRVAIEADTVIGFVVPSATPYARNVGYLGVLPEHRGRGLVDDLLAEVGRIHQGADRITATTDAINRPMAAAFERAGYRVTEVRLILTAGPAATEA